MDQDQVNVVDLTAELEFASRVAYEAATIVNTHVGSSEVRYKSDRSPVTKHRSANQLLCVGRVP